MTDILLTSFFCCLPVQHEEDVSTQHNETTVAMLIKGGKTGDTSKALLRNPLSSFWASLPSWSTQSLLFPYLPLKHCLVLWHSPVSLLHFAVIHFVLFHLIPTRHLTLHSKCLCNFFSGCVSPFRSKEKGGGEMTKRHFKKKEERGG